MDKFSEIIKMIDDFVWGVPMMALILAGGLLLTVRMRFFQIRRLPLALKWMVKNEEGAEGDISSFGALCLALSATIGTGNIVGVATAITTGGPGALFWMIVAALFGMATKYAEGVLAVKYRVKAKDGSVLGGPFYYIERGMGVRWKWLGKVFAVSGLLGGAFGIGTFTQINGISTAVKGFFDPDTAYTVTLPFLGKYSIAVVLTSVIVAVLTGIILIGGVKRIASVSEKIVPFMAIAYVAITFVLVVCNITKVPAALVYIVEAAFDPMAVTGGVVGSMLVAMQKGVARGIFSNEAGLGSAPIAAAAAQTNEPVRQGLVSMTGTFIDTIVLCTMTGLAVVVTDAWKQTGLEGVDVTIYAFQHGLPTPAPVSSFLVMISLVAFAFTTIISWNYYAERCLTYLVGVRPKVTLAFKFVCVAAIFIGPYMTVSTVWMIADIFNGMMAVPNMIAIFALNGVVVAETASFFKLKKHLN